MFSRYINLQVVITTLFSCYITFVFSLYQFRFLHFFSFFNFVISLQQLCFLVISTLFSRYIKFVFSLYQICSFFVFLLYQLCFLVISASVFPFFFPFSQLRFLFTSNFVFSIYQLCFLVISNLFSHYIKFVLFLFSCYINFVFLLYQLRFFHFFSNFLNFVFSLHRTSFSRYINFVFSLYQLHALVISTSCSFHVNFVPLVHLLICFGYSAHRSFYSTRSSYPFVSTIMCQKPKNYLFCTL